MTATPSTAEEVETFEYRMHDKLEALERLCSKLGLFRGDGLAGFVED